METAERSKANDVAAACFAIVDGLTYKVAALGIWYSRCYHYTGFADSSKSLHQKPEPIIPWIAVPLCPRQSALTRKSCRSESADWRVRRSHISDLEHPNRFVRLSLHFPSSSSFMFWRRRPSRRALTALCTRNAAYLCHTLVQ